MATHSSMLAWRILWTEEPRGLQSMELDKELDMTEQLTREDNVATHSSIPAWEIPWTEEPGRLQSMGSQRVGHNLGTRGLRSGIRQECFLTSPIQHGIGKS